MLCRFAEQRRRAAGAQPSAPLPTPAQPSAPLPTPAQPAASEREELQTLRKEQQVYDREVLEAERLERTRREVESMWQSLE
jgi:hypothetical protein